MRFRSYDSLRIFDVVARHQSVTAAAEELHLTKGAVSYQIGRLEGELGFPVFSRDGRGLALTERGKTLWQTARTAFQSLEQEIGRLREAEPWRITIGLATYFASRWLSPRLMTFIDGHPQVALRLQPLVDLIDLRAHDIDLAIRWGAGDWRDLVIEPLFPCPAFPTAGKAIAARVAEVGLEAALPTLTLLHDRDGSVAWRDWHAAAGLPYREGARRTGHPRSQCPGPGGHRRPGRGAERRAGRGRVRRRPPASDLRRAARSLRLLPRHPERRAGQSGARRLPRLDPA